MKAPAATIMERIEALARIRDEEGRLPRTFCSPAMRRANALVASWMRAAGMKVRQDAIGNLIGHYPAAARHGPPAHEPVGRLLHVAALEPDLDWDWLLCSKQ